MTTETPPKVLGREMVQCRPGSLAEIWTLEFGALVVSLGAYAEGRFNPKLGAWEIGVGESDARFVDRADAIAAIERELTSIRESIPEAKP